MVSSLIAFFGISARNGLSAVPLSAGAACTYASRWPSVATIVSPSGRINSSAPFSVKRDSSIEMANDVRAIIEATVFTGTSAIGSGIAGSSGKLSRDMPAIRVRERPQVMLAQWLSRNFMFTSPSGSRRT